MRDDKSKRRDITLMFDCLLDEIEEEDLKEVFTEFFASNRQTTASGGMGHSPSAKWRETDVAVEAGGKSSNQTQRGLTHARRQIQRGGQDRTLRRR